MNISMQTIMTYVIVAFAVFCALLYVILKIDSKKKKKSKQEKSKETSKKETIKDDDSTKEETNENLVKDESSENKSEVKKKKILKKAKNKPQVSRVYEKTERKIEETKHENFEPSISEDELLAKMQFVKSSSHVSKLTKFSELEPETQQALMSDEIIISEPEQEQVVQKEKVKHFDKTRRLSKCIKCGSFDDMFCSHIGDNYLNINADRHLKLGNNFHEKLYERAASTLANSSAKVDSEAPRETASAEGLTRRDSMKSWIENKKREELAKFTIAHDSVNPIIVDCEHDDLNLSARNLLLVDSIIHRKKMIKRK